LAITLIHSKERWMADKLIPDRIVTRGARRAPARTLLAIDMIRLLTSNAIVSALVTSKMIYWPYQYRRFKV
jgi:hypothetical protein